MATRQSAYPIPHSKAAIDGAALCRTFDGYIKLEEDRRVHKRFARPKFRGIDIWRRFRLFVTVMTIVVILSLLKAAIHIRFRITRTQPLNHERYRRGDFHHRLHTPGRLIGLQGS